MHAWLDNRLWLWLQWLQSAWHLAGQETGRLIIIIRRINMIITIIMKIKYMIIIMIIIIVIVIMITCNLKFRAPESGHLAGQETGRLVGRF